MKIQINSTEKKWLFPSGATKEARYQPQFPSIKSTWFLTITKRQFRVNMGKKIYFSPNLFHFFLIFSLFWIETGNEWEKKRHLQHCFTHLKLPFIQAGTMDLNPGPYDMLIHAGVPDPPNLLLTPSFLNNVITLNVPLVSYLSLFFHSLLIPNPPTSSFFTRS